MGRCVVFDGPGQPLRLCSLPVPTPGAREVLVRNEYTTLCRSDLSTWSGRRREAVPTILGHEVVGRVAACGPAAPRHDLLGAPLAVGDRLTWALFASDPNHPMARRGLPQKVPGMLKYGHAELTAASGWHGGLAEFTLLRADTPLVRIEADVPVQVAALTNCAMATAAAALRLCGDLTGRRLLVLGAGTLGLATAAQARQLGAGWIGVFERDAARAAQALRFGADAAFCAGDDPQTIGAVDVAIDCTGHPEAIGLGMQVLAIGGTAVWVGAVAPVGTVAIDPERVVRRMLTVRGLHNYTATDLAAAATFVQAHHRRFPFVDLVGEEFGLDGAEAAFQSAATGCSHRVGVRCSD
jgi:putative phosphonate catabolism associated alcohol dehydrogenase